MHSQDIDNLRFTREGKWKAVYAQFLQKNRSYLVVKRLFDIFLSLLVLIFLLSWLLPIIAILIKLDSKGPVFFLQKRTGTGGKKFNCIKFRSMVVNDQANTLQAGTNDPRITSLGNFLRKSYIDELPQFINVLLGEMSVVGPRPHMLKDCEDFSKVIPDYNLRHIVKPGITGIAQVKGYRGQTMDVYDILHRYQWDMFYIRNIGFALDIKLIRETIINALKGIFKSNETKAIEVKLNPVAQPTLIENLQEQFVEVFLKEGTGGSKTYIQKRS